MIAFANLQRRLHFLGKQKNLSVDSFDTDNEVWRLIAPDFFL